MQLAAVEHQMLGARPYFKAVSPGVASAIRIDKTRWAVRAAFVAWKARNVAKRLKKGETAAEIVAADLIVPRITRPVLKPVRDQVTRLHVEAIRANHDPFRKNGIGGRYWYSRPTRQPLVVVFHDANRAGPHVDVHLGRLSVVYRVPVEVYGQLRYNREGYLTEDSQKLLMTFVRNNIAEGKNCPQNLDHSRTNARASWVNGDVSGTNYGDGFTRQIIHESEVDIFKAHHDGPIEMYAPSLNPHRALYMYKLYNGDNKRAPIIKWGVMRHDAQGLEDRLHLTMVDEMELAARADMRTSTAKYDGASCYFIITPKGTTVWSPRTSKRTGERIEYTHKVNGIAALTSPQTIVGMGELLYKKDGQYVPAAVVGGILNSNVVLPTGYAPEIRIYRIDRVGSSITTNVSFWENRAIATGVAATHKHLDVVELMTPEKAHKLGYEGVVAVPHGGSVVDGFKCKWVTDADDWRIVSVDFRPGDKGGVAGIVRCVSMESGKTFNLGPSQVGDQTLTRYMMANPDEYTGQVLKVESRRGHEGRAAKVVDFHLDKGVAA